MAGPDVTAEPEFDPLIESEIEISSLGGGKFLIETEKKRSSVA